MLHCLYTISPIIAQALPSPTPQLPTMQEQWCSKKFYMMNTFIPRGEEFEEVWIRNVQQKRLFLAVLHKRCRYGRPCCHTPVNIMLGNCMQGVATLITSLPLQCVCQYPFIKVSFLPLTFSFGLLQLIIAISKLYNSITDPSI